LAKIAHTVARTGAQGFLAVPQRGRTAWKPIQARVENVVDCALTENKQSDNTVSNRRHPKLKKKIDKPMGFVLRKQAYWCG